MKLHPNSLDAYYDGRREVFPRRSAEILAVLSTLGEASDRQVCEHLGFTDMNAVRPRVTELLDAGVLEETGCRVDPVTERRVRVVRIVPKRSREQMALKLEVA